MNIHEDCSFNDIFIFWYYLLQRGSNSRAKFKAQQRVLLPETIYWYFCGLSKNTK